MENTKFELNTRNDAIKTMKESYKIISKYKIFMEKYILDFFTENAWDEIPEDWRNYLETLPLEDLTSLINSHLPLKNDPPETLKDIRLLINKYSLPRELSNNSMNINYEDVTPLYKEIKNSKSRFTKSIFKQVKHKKQHEIMIMSEVVYKSACENQVNFVIDIGSGKGHLARILALCYKINVIAIEQNVLFTHEAEKLDKEVFKAAVLDGSGGQEIFMPRHVTKCIEYDVTIEYFEDFIKSIYLEKFANSANNYSYGIIGLHPCGNLGPTLLRIYKDSEHCKFINLVSCCYHKLNTKYEPNPNFPNVVGYPLSSVGLEMDFELSYSLRELACHAIEKYSEKLSSGNYEFFTVHAYRAILEKLIMDKYPDRRHAKIANVKFKPGMLFYEYQEKALKDMDMQFSGDELNNSDTLEMLEKWKQVVIFYCLRLMFAPLIETHMLLDRHLFVDHYDSGFCDIFPHFNCNISPRTHILSARKGT